MVWFDWPHIDACIKSRDFHRAVQLYRDDIQIVTYKQAAERIMQRVHDLGFKMQDGKIVEKELWDAQV